MGQKFKVGQHVRKIGDFPYENSVFIIAADKDNTWKRAHPFNNDVVAVPDDYDYLLLLQQKNMTFSTQGISAEGIPVRENEIRLLPD